MTPHRKNSDRHLWLIQARIVLSLVATVLFIFYSCGQLKHEAKVEKDTKIKITCREYLLRGAQEEAGFGLYSYVLFSRKPANAKEIDRYLAVHQAFRTLHGHKDYAYAVSESLVARQNVNMTYWLLQVAANDSSFALDSLEAQPDSSQFFVDQYDYGRADLILKRYKGLKARGPFLVSSYYPLSRLPSQPEVGDMLIIDLSRIANDQLVAVFDYFQKKVLDDPKTWQGKFDFELIRIHFYSALALHGKPVLFAAKWVGDFFEVKKAFAGQ